MTDSASNAKIKEHIDLSSVDINQQKNQTKYYTCPFEFCGKYFKERGNLKTHLRVHVRYIIYFYSPEINLLYVHLKDVPNHSLLKVISRLI